MALPVFREAVIAGAPLSAAAQSAAFNTPAASGELLLAFVQYQDPANLATVTPDAGWALLGLIARGTADRVACYWRCASGAVAGFGVVFSVSVTRPYVALVAYQPPARGGMQVQLLDVLVETSQNSSTGLYGGPHLEPASPDGAAVLFFGFQYGTTQTYVSAPAGLPNLRASQDACYVFDGANLGGARLEPQIRIAQTGIKKWDALAVEIRALPPGLRPAGAKYVPDRVYEDPARRVSRPR